MSRVDTDVLEELDELEAASNARRDELRRIAADLPAAISRRALFRSVVHDIRQSPNKAMIVRRAFTKVACAPLHAAKRLQLKLRA